MMYSEFLLSWFYLCDFLWSVIYFCLDLLWGGIHSNVSWMFKYDELTLWSFILARQWVFLFCSFFLCNWRMTPCLICYVPNKLSHSEYCRRPSCLQLFKCDVVEENPPPPLHFLLGLLSLCPAAVPRSVFPTCEGEWDPRAGVCLWGSARAVSCVTRQKSRPFEYLWRSNRSVCVRRGVGDCSHLCDVSVEPKSTQSRVIPTFYFLN